MPFIDATDDPRPPSSTPPADDVFDFPSPAAPAKRGKQVGGAKAATADELADLLEAGFAGVSKLPGQDHWAIERAEAVSVAKPLARVLARQGKVSKWAGKHADTLLLAFTACALVGPRVALTYMGVTGSGSPVRRSSEHPRSAALDQLLRTDARGTAPATAGANPHANGATGAPGGGLVDPTADAVRVALGNIPQ